MKEMSVIVDVHSKFTQSSIKIQKSEKE